MAGNNSCGSRSIAYGNMVHNVLGIDAWLSDGSALVVRPGGRRSARRSARSPTSSAASPKPQRDEIEARWPKVMRRVGGYNLDIFQPQSERPYTNDGSVNLAHLLVGAEGTLAVYRSLKLKLAPLPRAKVLGVVNFPTFRAAMEAAQHLVELGPTAVELVDRTMIDLARANPAFRPTMEAALIGAPAAILLVEFSGDDRARAAARLQRLVELVADLGLPGAVVEMPDEAPQKALWEVRKAGLNIMMSLKGDGKPVSFIEDCAVPLEHLADYTDALTEVFARHGTRGTWYAHASVGTLHVRPILDMRARRRGARCARSPRRRARWCASTRAPTAASTATACAAANGSPGSSARHRRSASARSSSGSTRSACSTPNRIVDPPQMDDASLFRFRRAYRTIALKPVLDWSAWNVQNDPVTEATTAPGSGGDPSGGLAKAVEMCNNNGHCRKFDAGTMCPSYRVTRDEQHLTRGRANTLRLALSGQLEGVDAVEPLASDAVQAALDLCVGCKGCKRDCPTGVDMAKMKIECDGAAQGACTASPCATAASAACRPGAAWRGACRGWRTCATASGLLRRLGERWLGLSAQRSLPAWRRDTFDRVAPTLGLAGRDEALAAAKAVVLFVDTFNGNFETENAVAAVRVLQAAGYAVHVAARPGGGELCCGRTLLAAGMAEARGRGPASCSPPCCRSPSAASPSSASSRRAC